jgi:hypothetical protein
MNYWVVTNRSPRGKVRSSKAGDDVNFEGSGFSTSPVIKSVVVGSRPHTPGSFSLMSVKENRTKRNRSLAGGFFVRLGSFLFNGVTREFGLSRTRYVFVAVAVRFRSRGRAGITPVKSNGRAQILVIPDLIGNPLFAFDLPKIPYEVSSSPPPQSTTHRNRYRDETCSS